MEKQQNNNTKKVSYEELSNICNQLQTKCSQLMQQNLQLQQQHVLIRLEFLFKVLDKKENFDVNFVSTCIKEIVNLMSLNNKEEIKNK